MDGEQLKKLYFTCKKLGFAYNQEIGQDFPGWAVETVIKRGYWVAPKFLLIDYFRAKFGRPEQPGTKSRQRLRGLRDGENVDAMEDFTVKNRAAKELDHNDLMDLLPQNLRIVRVLYDKYGLSKTEIAYVFGSSQTNVTKHLKKSEHALKAIVRCDTSL